MIDRLESLERRLFALEQAVAQAEAAAAQAKQAAWQGGGMGVSVGGDLRFRWAKTTGAIGAGSANPAPSTLAHGEGPITFYDDVDGTTTSQTATARKPGASIATSRIVGVLGREGGPWDVLIDLCDA